MAPKMVTSFRRSLSFPNPPPNHLPKPKKVLHVRSTSLPCTRAHPIISQLQDQIAELHSWYDAVSTSRTSSANCLCNGLIRLKSVHESLDDLLLLPQTRESLHRGDYSGLIEKLLEDFLRFVDVYGIFQSLILRLKEEFSSAQIAVRRRKDDTKIALHFKNLSKIAKEIGKLVSDLISIGKSSRFPPPIGYSYGDDEVELIEVINDVVFVTVLVSVSVFGGISDSLAFRKTTSFNVLCLGRKVRNVIVEGGILEFREIDLEDLKKEDVKIVCKKMKELEDCIVGIGSCGEKAFRSLISTRVSLLNVLTQ